MTKLIFLVLLGLCLAQDPFDSSALRGINLGRANDDFGLNLLHQLELQEVAARSTPEKAKNLLISPFSVSSVLSMVLAGANTETHAELFKTLGFDPNLFKSDSDVLSTYKNLLHQLKSATFADPKNQLEVANSIAFQKSFSILQTYLDSITSNFESNVFVEDFVTKAHESTQAINKWVSEQTKSKIEKLFREDLNANTVMVLLNAIYFKGTWKTKFEKEKTAATSFELGQKTFEVPTMSLKAQLKIANSEDGQLLELPYNDALSMLIFLPNQETAKSFKSISSQFAQTLAHGSMKVSERLANLRNATVQVHLPKFKVEGEFKLKPTLESLGISKAFSTTADFSKMDGQKDLYLSEVMHKTFIEVSEEGAEAAAATGGVIENRSMPLHEEFRANRPFLFLIRDNMHQVTLFSGVINKP